MAPLNEFHASIADVTNDQHQNMDGLVQDDDFNAEVVVRFLRGNGIDASVDESTGGFSVHGRRYDACVACAVCLCLPARVDQLCDRGRLLVHEGETMMFKRSSSPYPRPYNGHRRVAPIEPLSARIRRLRIARGYSVYELATAAGVFAGTIQRLESGKPADKRVLTGGLGPVDDVHPSVPYRRLR